MNLGFQILQIGQLETGKWTNKSQFFSGGRTRNIFKLGVLNPPECVLIGTEDGFFGHFFLVLLQYLFRLFCENI